MKVLITGAGGFVGSHTFAHFVRNSDWELVLIDSFRHRGTTDRIVQQMEPYPQDWARVRVITHDLRAPFSPKTIQELGRIDYIVSVASESHVDRSIEQPREFIENNVQLVLTMLELARALEPEKFLHVSTDEVYGPAEAPHEHREGESHRPSNPYSASKAAQEDLCRAYWRTYELPVVVTNTMNIIGELQDPEKFVPKVLRGVLAGDAVPVHASAEGVPGSRFYLHARNQADALLFILTRLAVPTYGPDVDMAQYNVVGEREIDNLSMAQLVAKFANRELRYDLVDFHTSRPGHDLRYALDGTKLRELGWTPPVPLEDSLRKTIEWTIEHEEWLS